MAPIFLSITTWAGTMALGIHWYGRFEFREDHQKKEKQIQHKLTAYEARELSEPDFKYKKGDTTTRFFSREQLLEKAKKEFKVKFPDRKVLLVGESSTLDPQEMLVGPTMLKAKANELHCKFELLGGWDKPENEKKAEKIFKDWEKLMKKNGAGRG